MKITIGELVIEGTPEELATYRAMDEDFAKVDICEDGCCEDVPVAEEKSELKAGDFVKFVYADDLIDITAGKFYEVLVDDEGDLYIIDDAEDNDYTYLNLPEREIVSAAEAKWAKLGRNVGEYKKGDIVRVVSHIENLCVGEVGIVEDGGTIGDDGVGVRCGKKYVGICFDGEDVALIAPVESTLN